MDISSVVTQLRQEIERIEYAIAALVGLGSQPARRGRPPKMRQAKPASGQKRRRMSSAARARIAAAKKAWWAERKKA
jgi:outer membrane protein TolC